MIDGKLFRRNDFMGKLWDCVCVYRGNNSLNYKPYFMAKKYKFNDNITALCIQNATLLKKYHKAINSKQIPKKP